MPLVVTNSSPRLRIFVDADVLFAGSASPTEHGASLTILRMAEITLIDAFTSEQVIAEVERNLSAKLPAALTMFRLLVDRCLTIVPNPTTEEVELLRGAADLSDLPILIAASKNECPWLVTFNTRHYQPGLAEVTVLKPGEFVQRVRYLLSTLNF